MDRLAIVIPYYKISFFESTLKSLANQTEKRFQVYIGDDASPDNCTELIEKYSKHINISYVRFDQNLGSTNLVAHWNRCLAMVKTQTWIQILGDDDTVSYNFVASFYNALPRVIAHNCNVIRTSTYVINEIGERTSEQYTHPELETASAFFERKFSKLTRSSLSEYIFKKSVVIQKGFQPFNMAWHTDDLAIFEFSNSKAIYSINTAYVSVRVSEINITGNSQYYAVKNESTFQFIETLFSKYSKQFSAQQKKLLLSKLEMAYYNIPSISRWLQVLKLHFNTSGLWSSIDFIFRNFKNNLARGLKKLYLFDSVKRLRKE